MNSLQQNLKALFQKKISDSMTLVCYDNSQVVAGDRWLIEISCKVIIKNKKEFWTSICEEDTELLECIKEKIGQELVYSFLKKKFFVDDSEKETVLYKLVDQMKENTMQYISHPEFPMNFFTQQYNLVRDECLTLNDQKHNVTKADKNDEPADFSHLFKTAN